MNYQETLDFLYSRLPMFQRMGGAALKKDLSNTENILKRIGNPHLKTRYIHVAGTNGKGSTASMIAAVLTAAGYKTGLYTSPHLKSFRERMRINGVPISEDKVVSYVTTYQSFLEDVKPSFFEMTTAMAFHYFAEEKVDIAVIEVGLGGRLDSTNVIKPVLSVITQIGLDHQQFLGNSLQEITAEKAGIVKESIPVITAIKEDKLTKIIQNRAKSLAAPFQNALTHDAITKKDSSHYELNYEHQKILLKPELNASYQDQNIRAALAALLYLHEKYFNNLSIEDFRNGLANTTKLSGLKGRWQRFTIKGIPAIADTGHNALAVKHIVNMLQAENYKNLHIVWGMVDDKVIDDVLALLPKSAQYYFTQANVPRAMGVTKLHQKAQLNSLNGLKYTRVKDAILAAGENAGKDDLIFIGGSTFVVAEIEEL